MRPAPELDAAAGFQLREHRGQVVLVSFGYTSCPDICPTTLSQMRALYRALGDQDQRVAMAFVSVDPERDTPERLRDYVHAFDPRIQPVHLPRASLLQMLSAYGATAEIRASERRRPRRPLDPETYFIDHTSGFLVIDPRGNLRLHLPADLGPQEMASDIRRLLAEGA